MDSRELTKWNSAKLSPQKTASFHAIDYGSRRLPLNLVQDIVRLLHKHIWIVGICLALSLSVSLLFAVRQTRLYRATAEITIDRDSNAGVSLNKAFASAIGDADDYSVSLETQIRVLESRSLAGVVVRKLDLTHNAEFMRDAHRQFASLREIAPEPESIAVQALLSGLSVKTIKSTRVAEVSFTSRDRDLNAKVVNTLVDAFIEDNIRSRYEAANRAAKFLSAQLTELRAKVEESQQRLIAYEREHNIVMVDEKQNVVTSKLDDLNKQLTVSEEDRMEKEAAFQVIAAGSLDRIPESKSGEALQNLHLREADLKNEYAQATTTYGPNHPKVIELTNRIKAIDLSIQSELKRLEGRAELEYQVASRRERKLRAAFEAQKIEANRLNESAIQYGLLKRESEANRQLYDNLEERMKEAGVAAGLRSTNVRLIDAAEATGLPVSPNLPRTVYLGLFFGVLLSGIAVGIREALDRALRDPADVESFTAMPSLAIVPQHRSASRLLTSKSGQALQVLCLTEPRTAIVEAYRSLGTSILLASRDLKTLVITSPLPEEGKTMTAANVAVVLAQQGKSVLLVDADLRKPGLDREFGIAGMPGLSELLSGAASEQCVIQKTESVANLSIVTAGTSQAMSAEMLGSDKMRAIMQSWRERYDYVILDTPPIIAVTDAVRLSKEADSVLLVIRSGQTPTDALTRSCDVLNQANIPVLGIVVNGVSARSAGSYYYGYYPQLAKGYYSNSPQV